MDEYNKSLVNNSSSLIRDPITNPRNDSEVTNYYNNNSIKNTSNSNYSGNINLTEGNNPKQNSIYNANVQNNQFENYPNLNSNFLRSKNLNEIAHTDSSSYVTKNFISQDYNNLLTSQNNQVNSDLNKVKAYYGINNLNVY